MTYLKYSEVEVLQFRIGIFEAKIAEERAALGTGRHGPGDPAECPTKAGESRRERLVRWEATLASIRRVLVHYADQSVVA